MQLFCVMYILYAAFVCRNAKGGVSNYRLKLRQRVKIYKLYTKVASFIDCSIHCPTFLAWGLKSYLFIAFALAFCLMVATPLITLTAADDQNTAYVWMVEIMIGVLLTPWWVHLIVTVTLLVMMSQVQSTIKRFFRNRLNDAEEPFQEPEPQTRTRGRPSNQQTNDRQHSLEIVKPTCTT